MLLWGKHYFLWEPQKTRFLPCHKSFSNFFVFWKKEIHYLGQGFEISQDKRNIGKHIFSDKHSYFVTKSQNKPFEWGIKAL